MAANTDTVDRRKAADSDEGTFLGQVRQRGFCRQKVSDEWSSWTETVPYFEQWDGQTWRVLTEPDE